MDYRQKDHPPYEGVHCDECHYWFSKLYLFKQHHRKFHKDLGELIDLPPLPSFANTVKQLNLEDELWFAVLHTDGGNSVLMRIFEAETHATMRIINQRDIEQQRKRLINKGAGPYLTVGVLYNVYPEIKAEDTLSLKVVPRIQWDRKNDGTTSQPLKRYPFAGPPWDLSQYPRKFIFPENLNRNHQLNETNKHILSAIALQKTSTSNPFCDHFERIVNNL